MQKGTLNLTTLMEAIPRWPLDPGQIPFQFAAHSLEEPMDRSAPSVAPLFIQHLWPGGDRIRFYLSPDARHFYRMGILRSRRIKKTRSGYITSGEFMLRAPGMPMVPLELKFDDSEATLYTAHEALILGDSWTREDTFDPAWQRERGSALERLVEGGAILYDLPVEYRIQYLEAIGEDEYLLIGALDCAQFVTPENFTVFRGKRRQMAKLKVLDMEGERQQLTIMTDNGDVNLPGDSLLGLACAFPTARCTIQNLLLASSFESLLADKKKHFDAQMANVASQLGLEPDASEKLILAALGVDFGPFPTREAFEAWDKS